MKRLEPPTRRHQLRRQPVEQLRMAGRVAHHAKVTRRRDEPFAKVKLPDAVDDHTSHQWIVRVYEPPGQPEAEARRSGGGHGPIGRVVAEHLGHAGLNRRTRPRWVASLQNMGWRRVGPSSDQMYARGSAVAQVFSSVANSLSVDSSAAVTSLEANVCNLICHFASEVSHELTLRRRAPASWALNAAIASADIAGGTATGLPSLVRAAPAMSRLTSGRINVSIAFQAVSNRFSCACNSRSSARFPRGDRVRCDRLADA